MAKKFKKLDSYKVFMAMIPDHFQQEPGISFHYIKECADYAPGYTEMNDSEVMAVLAEKGRACGILGQLYYWGIRTKKDPGSAFAYFQKGKQRGDSQAALYYALMELAEGNMQGIDDLCFVLGKPGLTSIKDNKESKSIQLEAGEALYIVRRWLEKAGRQSDLQYYYDRIRQLWNRISFYNENSCSTFYVRGLILLFDLLPEKDTEAQALIEDKSSPYAYSLSSLKTEGVDQRGLYFMAYQCIAELKGDDFGSKVVETTIAEGNLESANLYIDDLWVSKGEKTIDLMDRYRSIWSSLNRPALKSKKKVSLREVMEGTAGILGILLGTICLFLPVIIVTALVHHFLGMSVGHSLVIGIIIVVLFISHM